MLRRSYNASTTTENFGVRKNGTSEKFGDAAKISRFMRIQKSEKFGGTERIWKFMKIQKNGTSEKFRDSKKRETNAEIHEHLESRSTFPQKIGAHFRRKSDNMHSK